MADKNDKVAATRKDIIRSIAQELVDQMGHKGALDHSYRMATASGNLEWLAVFNYIHRELDNKEEPT